MYVMNSLQAKINFIRDNADEVFGRGGDSSQDTQKMTILIQEMKRLKHRLAELEQDISHNDDHRLSHNDDHRLSHNDDHRLSHNDDHRLSHNDDHRLSHILSDNSDDNEDEVQSVKGRHKRRRG